MDSKLRIQLAAQLELYDKQRSDKGLPIGRDINLNTNPIQYGTAGFRGDTVKIEHLFYNVGLIAAIRSLQTRANMGIMITASHNPIQDNGVKLVESNGEMLSLDWEPIVEEFCNIHDRFQLLEKMDELIKRFKIDVDETNPNSRILIGMDTRPSSEALAALVRQGLEAWSPRIRYLDYGHITTPALHYLVAESTKGSIIELPLQSYYQQLISGFVDICKGSSGASKHKSYSSHDLVIDCANGIGFETMRYLSADESFSRWLGVELINTGDGVLNKLCGADFVKTMHLPPAGANNINKRYASLDGDADRVVYFYLIEPIPNEQKLHLLDGDKIMALYALYLKDVLVASQLNQQLSLGIVQTAYANGSSTDYITKELGLSVDCVDTGVKNLHKKASTYDFGIYFEANGHGTIWVSDKARKLIHESTSRSVVEIQQLLRIIINYTGDAISDILIVETILKKLDWHIERWFNLYQDRPSSLIKVYVRDRSKIKTTNAARTCVEPDGLQTFIDATVDKFGAEARCFVRASGTEDLVRVYAEASDLTSAERLANLVGDKIKGLSI